MSIISLILFTLTSYFILINTKISSKFLVIILSTIAFISGIKVHPFVKGLDVIYEKPVAKEIQKIVNDDKDALWASVNDFFVVNNYLLANGVKTLNSTNYYPNYNLWDVVDKEKKYENIWNRYSHLNIVYNNKETNVELLSMDSVVLYINSRNVCDLGINYFISSDIDLEKLKDNILDIKNIYKNDNMFIYKLTCK